jgi:hypothetical protein
MRKLLFILFFVIISTGWVTAQIVPYNPYVNDIKFLPAPTTQGFPCGSIQNVEFTEGFSTAADATAWQTNPMTIIICLTGFSFNTSGAAVNAISGAYADNYTWDFDPFTNKCIIGTQKQTMPGYGADSSNPNPLAKGSIKVSVFVPETAPINSTLAIQVNLQPAPYMSQFNASIDDQTSINTKAYCVIKIKGNIYFDATINNKVDGTHIYKPDGVQLFASLVDVNGLVIESNPVDSTGIYELFTVSELTGYKVYLSTTQGIPGNAPPTNDLPLSWIFRNEDCCDMIGTDGTANGILNVNLSHASVIQANFGIYSATPLPIDLNYFYASEYQCKSLLSWSTAKENNVSHIDVLRKQGTTGTFEKIASLQAKGNTTNITNYSFLDEKVESSNIPYEYKLKFVDLDNKIQFSNTRIVNLTCKGGQSIVNVFPNPATDRLNLYYVCENESETLFVKILDFQGNVISSKSIQLIEGSNVFDFDVSNYSVGTYLIKFHEFGSAKDGSIKFQKR